MKKLLLTLSAVFLSLSTFAQWNPESNFTPNSFTGVHFFNPTVGIVVSSSGEIFKTVNGGASWTLQTTSGSSVYGLAFGGPNNAIAVGAGGTALYSTDAGTTWTPTSTGQGYALSSVFFVDLDTAYAVGNNGTILKTYNGGASWFPRTSGIITDLYGVYFADFNTGFAVGLGGKILGTTDAGLTWTQLPSGSGANLMSVYFTDLSNGYACGQGGNILKTTDGGASWSSMASGTSNTLTSICFPDATHGYACGQAGDILKTDDAGSTWFLQTSGTAGSLNGIFFLDAMNGFAAGNGGTILNTTDGGCSIPVITIGGSTTICDQTSTNLTANGAGGYWTWTPNTALSSTNTATTTANPNTTTTYSISGYSIDGCLGSTTVTIVVNPIPSISTTPGDITCFGANDGATGATGSCISYTWQPGNIVATNLSNLSAGVYTVTGTDANGCMTTVTSPINEPGPILAGATLQMNATCNGINDGQLKNNTSGGTPPFTLLWMPGGQTSSTASGLGVGVYTLTVNDAQGCPAGTATISVGETNPIFATINGPAMLCQNQSTVLTYTATGVAPYAVDWYSTLNAGSYCSLDSSTYTQTTPGTESIILTVTDMSGCITKDTLSILIGYGDSLSGIITEPNSSPVTNGQVYLFQQKTNNVGVFDTIGVSPLYAGGIYSFPNIVYGNYFVKVMADTLSYPTAIATYYSNKSYPFQWDSALVINHYTCAASNVTGYNVTVLEITPLTGPGVISGFITAGAGYGQRTGPGATIMGAPLKGVDVKLGKNPGGSPAARTVTDQTTGQFTFTNVPLNQSFKIYVDIPNYGMDSVLDVMLTSGSPTSTQNNYYVDSLMIRVDTASAVGVITFKDNGSSVLLYPNPASDKIYVATSGTDKVEIILFNMTGNELKREILQNRSSLDISNLSEGIYFIRVKTTEGITTRKIVLQR